jgi:K+-transporting ATPase c subunit
MKNTIKCIGMVFVLFSLIGCETATPEQLRGTLVGAGLGAVIGGFGGYAVGTNSSQYQSNRYYQSRPQYNNNNYYNQYQSQPYYNNNYNNYNYIHRDRRYESDYNYRRY